MPRPTRPWSCIECLTTSTPVKRGGPSGAATLCNACGLRMAKRSKEGGGGRKRGKKHGAHTHTHTHGSASRVGAHGAVGRKPSAPDHAFRAGRMAAQIERTQREHNARERALREQRDNTSDCHAQLSSHVRMQRDAEQTGNRGARRDQAAESVRDQSAGLLDERFAKLARELERTRQRHQRVETRNHLVRKELTLTKQHVSNLRNDIDLLNSTVSREFRQ